ncbi:ABC-three component system middle component 5 [Halomonas dongshanensis]|uniref:Uncharacterized protein n=1 Tax=Halomonas dongshanensis TaxID=2890835 RepID=A0ABT2EC69_9GAMM|nr:ABC-three component system middle component 5 [Halomonas dongshanensis]MCS2609173.1 hypothetical protein [Halomonas dongshanensis]
MLIYHPAFDANHCLYRIVSILHSANKTGVSWSLLRLLDFYYLFPAQLKEISPWPSQISKYKRLLKNIPQQYEDINNSPRVFYDLEKFQKTAVLELIAKGIVSKESFEADKLCLVDDALPPSFIAYMKSDEFFNKDEFKIITEALPMVGLNGPQGLKKRSGLMEYIYDA